MRKLVAVITLLVLAAVPFLVVPGPASAGSSTDAALALGAFAVLNQIVSGATIFNGSPQVVRQAVVVEQPVIVQQPAVVYAPPPPAVVYAPAPPPVVYYAPAPPPVVVYPSNVYNDQGYSYAPPGYGYSGARYYKVHRRHHRDDED